MAIDHASAMVARTHFTEMWGVAFKGYPDMGWWFTRFVSHLCAPGFFFLMGMSMYLFAQKRGQMEWTDGSIRNYFLKRGGMILLFMLFLEFPGWGLSAVFSGTASAEGPPFPGQYSGGFFLPTTVLYGLGICMMAGSLLWKLGKHWLLLITITSFTFSGWYIGQLSPDDYFHPLAVLLYIPGITNGAMSLYPLIPWLGVTTFGMIWAKLLLENKERLYTWSLWTGLIFIAIFAGIRLLEWGNFHLNDHSDWITFFTLVKYPPSVAFILITCGINLVLLYIFSLIEEKKWLKPVKLFGQTAMFFYIVHLYLYALLGAPFPLGTSIWIMYLLWAVGLVVLYFICRWFLNFKRNKPANSLWRMV